MAQENLTPAQLERLKQQKLQRFRAMGLPATAGQIADIPVENMPVQRSYDEPISTPAPIQESYESQQYEMNQPPMPQVEVANSADIVQQIQEQVIQERNMRQSVMYGAPRDKFNALDAIRRGAKKQEFKTFMKAESPNNKFEEIKISKKPQRPGQIKEKVKNPVPVQTFTTAPKSADAEYFESLFTDAAPGINMRSTSSAAPQGQILSEDYSSYGKHFDPVAHLKNKAAEKGVDLDFTKRHNSQVFQTENTEGGQVTQMMLMMENFMKNQKNNIDLSTIKELMEATARRVAKETMKEILEEYVKTQQKKKNTFEVVNQEKKVVKIENKYFKLVPVVLKS
jgi:hypothetical protein